MGSYQRLSFMLVVRVGAANGFFVPAPMAHKPMPLYSYWDDRINKPMDDRSVGVYERSSSPFESYGSPFAYEGEQRSEISSQARETDDWWTGNIGDRRRSIFFRRDAYGVPQDDWATAYGGERSRTSSFARRNDYGVAPDDWRVANGGDSRFKSLGERSNYGNYGASSNDWRVAYGDARRTGDNRVSSRDHDWWESSVRGTAQGNYLAPVNNWWESYSSIQGDTLKTFGSFYHNDLSQVTLETEGRPLHADFEVWSGPSNTPTKVKVYSEDGRLRPFKALVRTPERSGSTMSIRNNGSLEYPMSGGVTHMRSSPSNGFHVGGGGTAASVNSANMKTIQGGSLETFSLHPSVGSVEVRMKTIQGGSLETFSLDPSVGSVEVTITTDGMPMYAAVELVGVSGHVKQVAEIYNDDGYSKPFSTIVETPGYANSIIIRNTGLLEFPMKASVEARSIELYNSSSLGRNSYYNSHGPDSYYYDSRDSYWGPQHHGNTYSNSYSNSLTYGNSYSGGSRWYD